MKVRELIRKLRKMDQEAVVVWQAHDQSEHEIDGWVRCVTEGCDEMLRQENEKSIVVLKQ